MKRLLIATLTALTCLSGQAATIEYDSKAYLSKQHKMLEITFANLEVESINNGREVKIIIPSEYGFKTGGHSLKPAMKKTLAELAHFLKTYPETTLHIVGHTDNVGRHSYNRQLGLQRAESVANALNASNVSPFRMSTLSEGEDFPRCTNSTKEGRECNRRVEVSIALERNLEF